jgi:hypothetical protein
MKARTCLLAPVGALGAALLSLLAGYGLSAGGVDRELTADELALIKGRQPLPTCYHCLYGYQVATPSCSEPEPCYGCVVGSGANCGLESWDPSFLESVDRYTVTYEDDDHMIEIEDVLCKTVYYCRYEEVPMSLCPTRASPCGEVGSGDESCYRCYRGGLWNLNRKETWKCKDCPF